MKGRAPTPLLPEPTGQAHGGARKPADRLDVDIPGPLSKTGKPHVVDHTLTQRGHGRSPFEFRHQELCPGTRADTPARSPQRLHPYGEAVQSNRRRSIETLSDDIKTEVSLLLQEEYGGDLPTGHAVSGV